MNITALITARGGSKGLPRKNMNTFCGKPLIQWSIELAQKSPLINRVIVSTDSQEIADLSNRLGAEVPFLRPASLASDRSPVIDTILHLLDRLPEIEYLILLQPTSPLRNLTDIKNAVEIEKLYKSNSVVTLVEHDKHPSLMFSLDNSLKLKPFQKEHNLTNRQSYEKVYLLNGAIYLVKRSFVIKNKKLINAETIASIMPKERSIDIDNIDDWNLAENEMKKINFENKS